MQPQQPFQQQQQLQQQQQQPPLDINSIMSNPYGELDSALQEKLKESRELPAPGSDESKRGVSEFSSNAQRWIAHRPRVMAPMRSAPIQARTSLFFDTKPTVSHSDLLKLTIVKKEDKKREEEKKDLTTSHRAPAPIHSSTATTTYPKQSEPPVKATNPHAPKLTRRDYYTLPSMNELGQMSDEELRQVKDFTIGRKGHGKIEFSGLTDVRGLDLDSIVLICESKPGVIQVYPEDYGKVPKVGQGLNKQAIITLDQIKIDNLPHDQVEKKLKRACRKMSAKFISYCGEEWKFALESFRPE